MRRFLLTFLLPAALLAGRVAHAENLKIGYVDVQRAVGEVDEGKAARSRLQGEVDDKKRQLDVKKSGFEKMQADYDKQATVLSDDAKKKKQEELRKAYVEMQQSATDIQDDLTKKEQAAMASISQRMIQVINEISEKDGFAFVLDRQALLYAPNSADITNEVVRRYNEKFSAPGTAAATPKSSGKK